MEQNAHRLMLNVLVHSETLDANFKAEMISILYANQHFKADVVEFVASFPFDTLLLMDTTLSITTHGDSRQFVVNITKLPVDLICVMMKKAKFISIFLAVLDDKLYQAISQNTGLAKLTVDYENLLKVLSRPIPAPILDIVPCGKLPKLAEMHVGHETQALVKMIGIYGKEDLEDDFCPYMSWVIPIAASIPKLFPNCCGLSVNYVAHISLAFTMPAVDEIAFRMLLMESLLETLIPGGMLVLFKLKLVTNLDGGWTGLRTRKKKWVAPMVCCTILLNTDEVEFV